MLDNSNIKLTINFNDPELDEEDRDDEVVRLLNELRSIDEVEDARRVLDTNPPEGSKAMGGFLAGLLSAEVNPANAKSFFSFLGDRLGGKPIELAVEVNGRKLNVTAHSREELEIAIEAAKDFISA